MNLNQSTAAFVLGIVPPEQLPDIAVSAMQDGLDSQSLAVLAGTPASEHPEDLRTLFEKALKELDLVLPSVVEAAELLKYYFAAQVAAEKLSPKEGARFIVERVFRKVDHLMPGGEYVGESFGIAPLVGLFYNYDDVFQSDRTAITQIDQAIVQECERISTEIAD